MSEFNYSKLLQVIDFLSEGKLEEAKKVMPPYMNLTGFESLMVRWAYWAILGDCSRPNPLPDDVAREITEYVQDVVNPASPYYLDWPKVTTEEVAKWVKGYQDAYWERSVKADAAYVIPLPLTEIVLERDEKVKMLELVKSHAEFLTNTFDAASNDESIEQEHSIKIKMRVSNDFSRLEELKQYCLN